MFTRSQYKWILESKQDTAVFAFGRLTPISTGHAMLLQKIMDVARQKDGMPMIFTSHTFDAGKKNAKNLIPYQDKLRFIKDAAPAGLEVVNSNAKTIYQVLEELGKVKHFKHIVIICGSDRIDDFKKTEKYKADYGIETIEVVSAGQRDPDADGITGISGTKLRQYAKDGNYDAFAKGAGTKTLTKEMYNLLRKNMGIES